MAHLMERVMVGVRALQQGTGGRRSSTLPRRVVQFAAGSYSTPSARHWAAMRTLARRHLCDGRTSAVPGVLRSLRGADGTTEVQKLARVGRIAPNRADALRDSEIRQNARLGDSAIRRFGNSVLIPRMSDGLGLDRAG